MKKKCKAICRDGNTCKLNPIFGDYCNKHFFIRLQKKWKKKK